MSDYYIGVDIGGTNIKFGAITSSGEILKKTSIKTKDNSQEIILSIICEIKTIVFSLKDNKLLGIGLGVPGLIDAKRGVVVYSGNLQMENVDLISQIKNEFNVPTKIENDANVATLGEHRFGNAKKYNSCVLLTLGTGVGSGIIIDGKLFSGERSAGAEIGHMVIEANGKECSCGGKGCFEAYASAKALKEMTKEAMRNNPDSKMWEIGNEQNVSGKTAFEFCEKDQTAKQTVEKYLDYLSIGIVNVANVFRPQAIIIGGGVSYEGDRLLYPLIERLDKNIFAKGLGPKVELVLASLRNDAGILGAAALVM